MESKLLTEYIKSHCPEAAQIPLQEYYPLNLYQQHLFNSPVYYPLRAMRKVKRVFQRDFLKIPPPIMNNWELQFLGENNFSQLKNNLMKRSDFNQFIPLHIISDYLDKFQTNQVKYAHPLSMLLTLVVFLNKVNQK